MSLYYTITSKFNNNYNTYNTHVLINFYEENLKKCNSLYERDFSDKFHYYLQSFYILYTYLRKYVRYNQVIRFYVFGDINFNNDYVSIVEKCSYLKNMSIKYFNKCNKTYKKSMLLKKRELQIDYADLLMDIGRFIPSIHEYKSLLDSCTGSSNYIFYLVYVYRLGVTLGFYYNLSGNSYVEKESLIYLRHALRLFREDDFKWYIKTDSSLIRYIRHRYDDIKQMYTFNNIKDFDKKEIPYRKWVSNNQLALNPANDINDKINVSADRISTVNLGYEKYYKTVNIFNLIKQKFASARFQMYEALKKISPNKLTLHYSDYSTDICPKTKNYIYGLYMEQLEMAFKQFYSAFDQISFLINKYFHLNIASTEVSFKALFNKNYGEGKHKGVDMNKLFSSYPNYTYMSSSGIAMRGLFWIYQSINNKNKNSGLNYQLFLARQMRNGLEHRGVYIIKDNVYGKEFMSYKKGIGYISFSGFYKILLTLARTCREAIILLDISIGTTIGYFEHSIRKDKSND